MRMGKLFIAAGLIFFVVGLGFLLFEQLGIEKLPGDILIRGERTTFFFPITTCIILSVLLTFLARFINR